jgi:hypothetical protein
MADLRGRDPDIPAIQSVGRHVIVNRGPGQGLAIANSAQVCTCLIRQPEKPMKALRIALASLVLVSGISTTLHAQNPPPPPPKPEQPTLDPTGNYNLNITFGGQAVPVALEMWKESGVWKGSAGNSQLGFANISAVVVEGRDVKITLVAENGPTFNMRINVKPDSTVTGTWEGNGDGSPITGKKTK